MDFIVFKLNKPPISAPVPLCTLSLNVIGMLTKGCHLTLFSLNSSGHEVPQSQLGMVTRYRSLSDRCLDLRTDTSPHGDMDVASKLF